MRIFFWKTLKEKKNTNIRIKLQKVKSKKQVFEIHEIKHNLAILIYEKGEMQGNYSV
jgi:hypothetical protein